MWSRYCGYIEDCPFPWEIYAETFRMKLMITCHLLSNGPEHTRIHAHAYTHIHTHTHMYTHTRTHLDEEVRRSQNVNVNNWFMEKPVFQLYILYIFMLNNVKRNHNSYRLKTNNKS